MAQHTLATANDIFRAARGAREWETKAWGLTRLAIDSPHYQLHELIVERGGYSSVHYHTGRANTFRVLDGEIRVVMWEGFRPVAFTLEAGKSLHIPSMVAHQFQVLESGLVVEEYYADRGGVVASGDIVRLSVGGQTTLDLEESGGQGLGI